MSHSSYWHLLQSVPISDPDGFFAFLDKMEKTENYDAMPVLFRWSMYEKTKQEDRRSRTTEKVYSFSGLYPEKSTDPKRVYGDESNGRYGINHFELTEEHLKWIAELSQFVDGPIEFIVFEEGWPTLDAGYVTFVKAEKGKASSTPMQLKESK